MIDSDIRIILENLPTTVKGFVYKDSSYNPCIVLNARLPEEIRRKTFKHEMAHILRGDIDNKDYKEYSA